MTLCVCGEEGNKERKKEGKMNLSSCRAKPEQGPLGNDYTSGNRSSVRLWIDGEASCSCCAPSHSSITIHFSLTG